MSRGLFQNLPGTHEGAGSNALPTEPWLLPICDRAVPAGEHKNAQLAKVYVTSRGFRIAMHSLVAALFLIVMIQIATNGMGYGLHQKANHQVAVAAMPTTPSAKGGPAMNDGAI